MTPLGGWSRSFNMLLGCISARRLRPARRLYGFLVHRVIAVFVAGAEFGRTPEYLGKKSRARDVKLAMLAV